MFLPWHWKIRYSNCSNSNNACNEVAHLEIDKEKGIHFVFIHFTLLGDWLMNDKNLPLTETHGLAEFFLEVQKVGSKTSRSVLHTFK